MPPASTADRLTPEQTVACDFWVEFSSASPLALYFIDELRSISERYTGDELDDYCDEVDRLLARVGYPVTTEILNDTYPIAQRQRADFWAGAYTLVDSEGRSHRLQIDPGSARLSNDSAFTDEWTFKDGVLTFSSERLSATLQLALPPDTATELRNIVQPSCSGEIQLGQGAQARRLKVHGRRGCYLQASIEANNAGDPLEFWVGSYLLRSTSGDRPAWLEDSLQVRIEAGRPAVDFGGRALHDVRFENNTLLGKLDRPDSHLALRFHSDGNGNQGFVAAWVDNGELNSLEGFKRPEPAKPKPRVSILAVGDGGTVERANDEVTFTIDMTKHREAVVYELPMGVERNPYELKIKLINGSASYTWQLDTSESPYKDILELDASPAGIWAKFRGAFGETQHAGKEPFVIRVTPQGQDTAIVLSMKLLVQSRNPITISTDLPPITRGMKYRAVLVANGGEPPYTWTVSREALPPGLILDSNVIEGTVSDVGLSQTSYTVPVRADAANTIIMAPATDILAFHIEEPVQTASSVTGWFNFVFEILAAGGAVLVLGQWITSRVKRAKGEKKSDPVEQMKTMMSGALNRLTASLEQIAAADRSARILGEIGLFVEPHEAAAKRFQDSIQGADRRKSFWDARVAELTKEISKLDRDLLDAVERQDKALEERLKLDKENVEEQRQSAEDRAKEAKADRKKYDKERKSYEERVDRLRDLRK